jgi:hypothetical protein
MSGEDKSNVEKTESNDGSVSEQDLDTVSGGLSIGGGTTLSTQDTSTCFSQL